MDIEKMKNHPLHAVIQDAISSESKDFLLYYKHVHDLLGATPKEFVNGAVIKNKETGEASIFTLTVTVENNVTEERINQYAEESLIEQKRLEEKWAKEEK